LSQTKEQSTKTQSSYKVKYESNLDFNFKQSDNFYSTSEFIEFDNSSREFDCEISKRDKTYPIMVKSNLRKNVSYWQEIKANDSIINIISEGYKIPFISNPKPCLIKNNKSSFNSKEFVEKAIQELLETDRIKQVSEAPYCVNPLSVATQRNGKKRLILDVSEVNKHVYKEKIKFDDWRTMSDYIESNQYMYKFDIKQGYHHIDIHEDSQKYLGFSWIIEGKICYFIFTVLPFGLTSAPFIFTKVVRVLVKHWRKNSVKIACFLDDGLGVGKDFAQASKESKFVKESLFKSGFVVNEEKSVWCPTQKLSWLGIEVDLASNKFEITLERIESICSTIEYIIKSLPYTTARTLAKLTGKIISTKFVLGGIVQLKTRNLYKCIEYQQRWDSRVNLKPFDKVIQEIHFWKDNLYNLNLKYLKPYSIPKLIVSSDASNLGIAAFVKINGSYQLCFKNLTTLETTFSSTWRELYAIKYALESFSMIKNEHILWQTDNFAASLICKNGSSKPDLQLLAENIYDLCKKNSLVFDIDWIPRGKNQIADTLCKNIDYDDWKTTRFYFNELNNLWGPFTVDRFADNENTKVNKFNSKYWCPGTSNVNAFSIDWSEENNFLVPPVYLIPKVLQHMKCSKSTGTLVVPYWPSATFWPMIVDNNQKFQNFVEEFLLKDDMSKCLQLGNWKRSIIGSKNCKSGLLALKLNFNKML